MAVAWTYTPPTVNAIARVHGAGETAVAAAAEHLLEAAKRVVPVDTGALRDSGEVTHDGLEAAVSFGREDGAGRNGQDTAAYAIVQHERMDYHHPTGQAKFLEQPMHAEAEAVAEILGETVRKALLP